MPPASSSRSSTAGSSSGRGAERPVGDGLTRRPHHAVDPPGGPVGHRRAERADQLLEQEQGDEGGQRAGDGAAGGDPPDEHADDGDDGQRSAGGGQLEGHEGDQEARPDVAQEPGRVAHLPHAVGASHTGRRRDLQFSPGAARAPAGARARARVGRAPARPRAWPRGSGVLVLVALGARAVDDLGADGLGQLVLQPLGLLGRELVGEDLGCAPGCAPCRGLPPPAPSCRRRRRSARSGRPTRCR